MRTKKKTKNKRRGGELPDNFDLRSHDMSGEKQQDLLRLFPEVRTEGGKIDFDRLKLALGESVDVGKERYGMNWPGKADCFKAIQSPSMGTLRPCPKESVEFDTTENLIIEGDNLEVLKLLQKSYLGKVKMIYIDPPYNTGNDFIYPDNYSESLQTYLEYTGQVDDEGKKVNKSVYEHVVYDSEIEREFARKLDERDDIKLFVKLPRWFEIDTPVGKYNPDWAIVKNGEERVYLVRETKGTRDYLKLRTSEADKVRCGQKHFESIGVPFAVAVTADEV